jgi:plastocyanin
VVVLGTNGALQNVFIYVKDGLGNLRFPVPSTPAVLDQKGCRYVPHVLGVQVGQPVEIVNSDPTLHNVHAVPATNQEFNTGQPIQGMKHMHTFSTTEVMVPFKCDVHGWMRAYIGVLDHPFYAVTGADGSFTLKGLPPGTYTVEAWHESLGTQTQSVTIGASERKDVGFIFKAA